MRSRARCNACEGAMLVVDASQGAEAQTLANLYLALEANLHIIPVINKIDLPHARPDEIAKEVGELLGDDPDGVLRISRQGRRGHHAKCWSAWCAMCRRPRAASDAPLAGVDLRQPLRRLQGRDRLCARGERRDQHEDQAAAGQHRLASATPIEIGTFTPRMTATGDVINAGEVGYVATGFKTVRECRVGDTIDRCLSSG